MQKPLVKLLLRYLVNRGLFENQDTLDEGMIEQETSSNPFFLHFVGCFFYLEAISLALGEYLITTVLYIEFTSSLENEPALRHAALFTADSDAANVFAPF